MLRLVMCLALASTALGMQSLTEVAASLNETQFTSLIDQAGLASTLNSGGPYTILAPTDAAFGAIPKGELDALLKDPAKLADVLKYHVLEGEVFSWDVVSGTTLKSITGHVIRVYKTASGEIHFNNAKAIKVDVEAANGVIYLIDTVLDVPEGTLYQIMQSSAHNLTNFLKAVDLIHYDRILNSTSSAARQRYTVFAPSDAAFEKLGADTLQRFLSSHTLASELVRYHIHGGTLHYKSLDQNGRITTLYSGHYLNLDVSSGDVVINRVTHLEETDIEAENGVIHVIDHVLIPSTLGSIIG